jgi:hypothetical protein
LGRSPITMRPLLKKKNNNNKKKRWVVFQMTCFLISSAPLSPRFLPSSAPLSPRFLPREPLSPHILSSALSSPHFRFFFYLGRSPITMRPLLKKKKTKQKKVGRLPNDLFLDFYISL